MRKKNDAKKEDPRQKNRDVFLQFDTTLYALAGYLAQYVSMLRHAASKPVSR
jgi:hypothetical protein